MPTVSPLRVVIEHAPSWQVSEHVTPPITNVDGSNVVPANDMQSFSTSMLFGT